MRCAHRANLGVAAGAQSPREKLSDLNFVRRVHRRAGQRLIALSTAVRLPQNPEQGHSCKGCSAVCRVLASSVLLCNWPEHSFGLTCASVLMIQNSTPWSSVKVMRLTAFEPPPPTPSTCRSMQERSSSTAKPGMSSWGEGSLTLDTGHTKEPRRVSFHHLDGCRLRGLGRRETGGAALGGRLVQNGIGHQLRCG